MNKPFQQVPSIISLLNFGVYAKSEMRY